MRYVVALVVDFVSSLWHHTGFRGAAWSDVRASDAEHVPGFIPAQSPGVVSERERRRAKPVPPWPAALPQSCPVHRVRGESFNGLRSCSLDIEWWGSSVVRCHNCGVRGGCPCGFGRKRGFTLEPLKHVLAWWRCASFQTFKTKYKIKTLEKLYCPSWSGLKWNKFCIRISAVKAEKAGQK